MNKEFLFGKFYEVPSIDDEEKYNAFKKIKDEKYKNATQYEINKNSFVLDWYDNEDTMKVYYNSLKKNIIYLEEEKEKDLMHFSSVELIDMFNSVATSHVSTKNRLYHLVDGYLNWCVNKGFINTNNLIGLDKNELTIVSKRVAKYKVLKKSILLKELDRLVKTGSVSVIDVMPLVLSRYGIVGESLSRILNLRFMDIDRVNKYVKVYEDDKELLFPIDDEFIEWIDRADNCMEFEKNQYFNDGYVIKRRSDIEEVTENFIYNRVLAVFRSSKIKRISFKNLELSRKIDFLLTIRENRVLTFNDFKTIMSLFKPDASPGTKNGLIKSYESLTGDRVALIKDKVKMFDENPKETVARIKKEIGF